MNLDPSQFLADARADQILNPFKLHSSDRALKKGLKEDPKS